MECQRDRCGRVFLKPHYEPDHMNGVPYIEGLKCPWCGGLATPVDGGEP